jgi:pilus assembly protein Flp/PilA
MKKMMNWLKNEESGQGMVEYALIIALVGVLLIAALGALRGGVDNAFGKAVNNLK